MGDLDSHDDVDGTLGALRIGDRNRDGERAIDFFIEHPFFNEHFFKHKDERKWYYWNDERQEYTYKSMTDKIITNNKTLLNDVKATPSLLCDSDHSLLIGRINSPQPTEYQRTNAKAHYYREFNKPRGCHEVSAKKSRRKLRSHRLRDIETE